MALVGAGAFISALVLTEWALDENRLTQGQIGEAIGVASTATSTALGWDASRAGEDLWVVFPGDFRSCQTDRSFQRLVSTSSDLRVLVVFRGRRLSERDLSNFQEFARPGMHFLEVETAVPDGTVLLRREGRWDHIGMGVETVGQS